MITYSDLVDAILKDGRWGPHNVEFPFSMDAQDALDLKFSEKYIAQRALTITCLADIANAVKAGHLKVAK